MGYSPWGRKESDTTERLTLHFSVLQLSVRVGDRKWCSGIPESGYILNKANRPVLTEQVEWNVRVCTVAQSCFTLCDPVDCSRPGSSVHGILQARILKWVAISYSRPRD